MADNDEKRTVWGSLRSLTFRDGFWFLLGAVMGCHAIQLIDKAVAGLFGGG